MSAPSWQPRWFRCLKCGNGWNGWLPMHVQIEVAIAVLKAMRCPKCSAGSRRIVFDLERERAEGET